MGGTGWAEVDSEENSDFVAVVSVALGSVDVSEAAAYCARLRDGGG